MKPKPHLSGALDMQTNLLQTLIKVPKPEKVMESPSSISRALRQLALQDATPAFEAGRDLSKLSEWAVGWHKAGFYQAFLPEPDWKRIKKIYMEPKFHKDGMEAYKGLACARTYETCALVNGLHDWKTVQAVIEMEGDFRRISEKHGHKKLFGSHLDESTLQRTELMSWRGVFDRKWSGHFAARKAHPDLWEKISVASGTEENQAIQASSVLDALELQSDNGGSIWG